MQNVASRGLDLPDVRWIVQYTTPGAVQDYVHRVGRTARVGKQGHALLFIMPAEVEYLKSLAGHGIRYGTCTSTLNLMIECHHMEICSSNFVALQI